MADATFDYAGLNHLGWLNAVHVDGVDRLPSLLSDPELLGRIEEGRLFGAEWLQTLGAIPNEYLWYWYFRSDALAAELEASETRGEQILRQQEEFYARTGLDEAASCRTTPGSRPGWPASRRTWPTAAQITDAGDRDPYDLDGGGYDRIALGVMRAVARDEAATLVLNVANRGTPAVPGRRCGDRGAVPDRRRWHVGSSPVAVGSTWRRRGSSRRRRRPNARRSRPRPRGRARWPSRRWRSNRCRLGVRGPPHPRPRAVDAARALSGADQPLTEPAR